MVLETYRDEDQYQVLQHVAQLPRRPVPHFDGWWTRWPENEIEILDSGRKSGLSKE